MTLARAFPKCEFHGYDISAKSLAAAQDRHAANLLCNIICTTCKNTATGCTIAQRLISDAQACRTTLCICLTRTSGDQTNVVRPTAGQD